MRRMSLKRKLPVLLLVILVLGLSLHTGKSIQAALISKRRQAAETVIELFGKHLIQQLEAENFASKLMFALNTKEKTNLTLFEEKAAKLQKDHAEIRFLSYFEQDTLQAIYPREKYKSAIGMKLHDVSYSYTLAKVIKDGVIAGPEKLSSTKEEVFLFIEPLYENNQYKGEIIAAVDSAYLIKAMNLEYLQKRGYEYELWRVNALGEKKTVVRVSDPSVDFSEAVKLEVSLPATWNLSILPENGWLPYSVKLAINGICLLNALLILALVYLALRVHVQKKQLIRESYTDADSGLLTREGFFYFMKRAKQMQGDKEVSVLYIQLYNFYKLCKNSSMEEMQAYLQIIQQGVQEHLPVGSIAARLSEEEFVITIFEDTRSEKAMEAIEDFILQLFWKKKIQGKKVFVEPKSAIVRCVAKKTDAEELLKLASMRLNALYDLHS